MPKILYASRFPPVILTCQSFPFAFERIPLLLLAYSCVKLVKLKLNAPSFANAVIVSVMVRLVVKGAKYFRFTYKIRGLAGQCGGQTVDGQRLL